MFDAMKRHEIQVLRRAGHTQAEVARLAGTSERTVRRVGEEPAVTSLGAGETERRGIGRPSKAEAFRPFVTSVLAGEPEVLSLEILRQPRRGNQKGAVDNLVGWVKGSFFKQRRFLDQADLLAQLAAWKVEVNTELSSRATGVTPAARMTEDRARLRPLKVAPEDLALRIPILVGPTGYVLHEWSERVKKLRERPGAREDQPAGRESSHSSSWSSQRQRRVRLPPCRASRWCCGRAGLFASLAASTPLR